MAPALSLSSRIKIPDHVLFRGLEDELVLLELNQGVYFGLDAMGTRIWHLLRERRSLQEVLGALLQEYAVTKAECAQDLLAFIGGLQDHGLVELCP